MELPILPHEGTPQLEPARFEVWQDEMDDYHPEFKHLGRIVTENHVSLNGQYLGLLHLETTGDGQIAAIDGIDFHEGVVNPEFTAEDWDALASRLCTTGIINARRVDHPLGQKLFLEAL